MKMDDRGRLTPGDGQAYINFCERWGQTPQGETLKSCSGCARVIGHSDNCPGGSYRSFEEMIWDKFQKIVR